MVAATTLTANKDQRIQSVFFIDQGGGLCWPGIFTPSKGMSSFCSLDEAFMGPIMTTEPTKKKKKSRDGPALEHFVPAPLSSTPAVGEGGDDVLKSADQAVQQPPATKVQSNGGEDLQSLFPLPGETAEPEAWQKAFMLQPSQVPQPLQQQMQHKRLVPMLANGAMNVNGAPTLWRQIPEPMPAQPVAAAVPIPSEINKRLDALTRQLESLTTPTPLQSTAELFLFVAIGLLILLAIDSLLRFASGAMNSVSSRGGGGRSMGRLRSGWARFR